MLLNALSHKCLSYMPKAGLNGRAISVQSLREQFHLLCWVKLQVSAYCVLAYPAFVCTSFYFGKCWSTRNCFNRMQKFYEKLLFLFKKDESFSLPRPIEKTMLLIFDPSLSGRQLCNYCIPSNVVLYFLGV